jgi:ABC-type spermidine/putrescine transport system permease subunit I
MRIARGARAIVAGSLCTAAVFVGLFAVAGFVGGGADCARAQATKCDPPNATALIVGIAIAVVLGIVGALIWRPGPERRRPRRPWEYLD